MLRKRERYVEYSSNNSGGDWWLSDKDWKALEKAGWEVKWIAKDPHYQEHKKTTRFLGALAQNAKRYGLSLTEAVAEWEMVTGKPSTSAGCPCCGQPHNFTEYNAKGEYIKSGPHTSYECSW